MGTNHIAPSLAPMGDEMIDPNFDFRTEIRPELDPDLHSPTLRQYHKTMWSKPLPNGVYFGLTDSASGQNRLDHRSFLGEFVLSSDLISNSYLHTKRMSHVVGLLTEERKEAILRPLNTIGGFTLFPAKQIDRKQTINQERGINKRIEDRFDLTLECIRRHYHRIESPLEELLDRYHDFFALFQDFQGYVEFFLLQDLVSGDYSTVRYLLPFDDSFPLRPLPESLDQYNMYIDRTIEFVQSRGSRMAQ